MPAKPLTPEQKADANRLRLRYNEVTNQRRLDGKSWVQDEIAAEIGMGQSALAQYLGGKIPLNGPVLLKFCALLDCLPEDISPAIYEQERTFALKWVRPSLAKDSIYRASDPDEQSEGGVIMTEWKFTPELLAALQNIDNGTRLRAENGMRMALGMALIAEQPQETKRGGA